MLSFSLEFIISLNLLEAKEIIYQFSVFLLIIEKPNTVLLGMGIATLVCEGGQPCIKVANVDGVKIAGLLLQAGRTQTSTLLEWGRAGTKYEGKASNPGIMSDLFARVGGPD